MINEILWRFLLFGRGDIILSFLVYKKAIRKWDNLLSPYQSIFLLYFLFLSPSFSFFTFFTFFILSFFFALFFLFHLFFFFSFFLVFKFYLLVAMINAFSNGSILCIQVTSILSQVLVLEISKMRMRKVSSLSWDHN